MEISDKNVAEFAQEIAQIPFFNDLDPGVLLGRVSFLKDVDREFLEEIAPKCILRVFQQGEVVCHQGEYGNTFYLILKGKVEVSVRTQENPHIALAVLEQEDFFGEYAPLAETARTATVTALDRAILIEVGKEAFLSLRDNYPSVKDRIDKVYFERILATQLRKIGLFQDLPNEVIEALKDKVELEEFDRGDVIIKMGDRADSLYLIRSGFVKVRIGEGDDEKVFAYLKDGSYFGEMSLLHGGERNADVVAVTRIELVKIHSEDFVNLIEKFPGVKERLELIVAQREEDTKEISEDDERARKMKFAVDTGLVQAGRILLIDLDTCLRCNSCVEACAATHDGFPRIQRTGQKLGRVLLPTTCLHCTDPECMLCPHGGIYRDKDGEIHHTVQCIHCGGCARRCPYGNILIIKIDDKKQSRLRWPFGGKGKVSDQAEEAKKPLSARQRVVKCDMCFDQPFIACVYNCPVGACRVITPEQFLELSTE